MWGKNLTFLLYYRLGEELYEHELIEGLPFKYISDFLLNLLDKVWRKIINIRKNNTPMRWLSNVEPLLPNWIKDNSDGANIDKLTVGGGIFYNNSKIHLGLFSCFLGHGDSFWLRLWVWFFLLIIPSLWIGNVYGWKWTPYSLFIPSLILILWWGE